ncbi:MAG: hypothetical protein RL220_564 [Bacteroidota bacterium]
MQQKLKPLHRLLLLIGAAGLVAVIYLPMWRIDLVAPQYPEGLMLQINPDGLAGDVEIINGLNHYIGMKTMHSEDFWEFSILPWIIAGFAGLFILTALLNRKKVLYGSMILFLSFGILAMYDFWKWEYDYGHDLDPNAAIKVPGMAYQPPLIGFKQLLNFGAYSIPDTGGWIFIGVGMILAFITFMEWRGSRMQVKAPLTASIALMLLCSGCTEIPAPIQYSKDQCAHCRMSIEDARYACEIVTDKNKVYKFDDVFCAIEHINSGKTPRENVQHVFLSNYLPQHGFLKAEECFLLESDELQSPMNSNIAAFATEDEMRTVMHEKGGRSIKWINLLK